MAALAESDVFARVGGLFDDGHRWLHEAPFGSEGLIKPLGHVAKFTDLPWHRDCGGRCAWNCSSYSVGLPLSATNAEVGMLQVVAGSHRANVPPPDLAPVDWGLPIVSLPTEPGDLTIHLSCTLHTTTTSVDVERTVAYATFGMAP
jgi:ectoine hydroxylase-related dioxygenase (phytanoyl-CoA dioxygenase family)